MTSAASLLPILVLLAAPGAYAIEIATGKMLGDGFDARSFYVRDPGGAWRKTYTGPGFRPEAAGRLMNMRIAQALFQHDLPVVGALREEFPRGDVRAGGDRVAEARQPTEGCLLDAGLA